MHNKLIEVSSEKNEELHRLAQKASYLDLFDRLKDGIMLLDTVTYRPRELNIACQDLFDLSLDTYSQFSLVDNIRTEDRDQFLKHMGTLSRRYHNKTWQTQIMIKDEWKHFELSMGSLDLSNDERVIQIIFKDIDNNMKLQEQLELMSNTDKLTGFFNRRFFDAKMKEEMERALRSKSPFSLIMIDIDHFKKYNDRNGHPAGDSLLQEFTLEVKNRIRGLDFACRYGGEEFAIICPNTSLNDAVVVAERIKKFIENKHFLFGEFQPMGFISASIGISNFPLNMPVEWKLMDAETKEAFLLGCIAEMKDKSDKALYMAKEQGRNKVIVAC